MRSDAYWAMRAAQQEDISDRKAREAVRQVQAIYDKAISDIEADIKQIFRKYAKDGRLSLEEAKKLLSTKETAAALEELRKQLAGIKDKAARRKLLARINAPAYAARISRLEALLDKIDAAFYRIAEIQLQAGRQRFIEAANDAFLRTIWGIQTDTGFGFSFTLLPQRAIEKALEHTWDGKNYSDRVWQSTGAAAAYAKKIVTAGLASGKSSRRMARELDELTQAGEYNCMRLIRTENNYFHNLGALQGYKEAGLTKYRYLATLDSRTCKVCGVLDNKVFPIKDAAAGKNYPPIHPNDRCTTTGVIQGQDRSRLKRSARDPATGKTVYVPADMSYTAWRESLSENQDGALQYSQKLAANRGADKKQWEKYKIIFGKDFPDTFADFQKMKYNNTDKWEAYKQEKQSRLNQMSIDEVKRLNGKLGNFEVRSWYKTQDEQIVDKIDTNQSLENQARQAYERRNANRTQARDLMADQEARRQLDKAHPNQSFAQLLEHKKKRYSLTDEAAYKDILRSSGTTNKQYDKKAGLKEGEST